MLYSNAWSLTFLERRVFLTIFLFTTILVLTNDDEVYIQSLSSILLAVHAWDPYEPVLKILPANPNWHEG